MLKGDISGVKEAFKSTNEPGIKRFDDALLGLYKNGRVSMEEALANSDPRADLEAKINFG
jgi:twitching motility protein PilU